MSDFTQNLSLILNLFLKNHDNDTFIGDFDLSSDDVPPESFLQIYNLTSLIKEAKCFRSSNPSWFNLILTNQKNINKLCNTFEIRISDHHKLISTTAKSESFNGRLQKKITEARLNF